MAGGWTSWFGLAVLIGCVASSQRADSTTLVAEDNVSELRVKALLSVEDVKKLHTGAVAARESMEVALRRELARLDVSPTRDHYETIHKH